MRGQLLEAIQTAGANGRPVVEPPWLSAADLCGRNPDLRPPIIDGMLRAGETMNLIGTSKTGKSWLAHDLLLSVASGLPWLGRFNVQQGRVLLLDNELHPQTLAHRLPKIAAARGIDLRDLGSSLAVRCLRGKLQDIHALGSYFAAIADEGFRVIVADAFYRFWPEGMDENKNADVARVYNLVDAYAAQTGAAFVLIHHSSKGTQSEKTVSDVGAGAGAQSRAADAHVVLRPHADDGAVVMEAVVRSWKPFTPTCLRWTFPVWGIADDLDPTDLRQPGRKKHEAPAEPEWTPATFAGRFIADAPQRWEVIEVTAGLESLSGRRAKALLRKAVEQGIVIEEGGAGRAPKTYRSRPI